MPALCQKGLPPMNHTPENLRTLAALYHLDDATPTLRAYARTGIVDDPALLQADILRVKRFEASYDWYDMATLDKVATTYDLKDLEEGLAYARTTQE